MKNTILIIFIFLFTLGLKGQSIRFSQFYSSPLLLNPALTGSSSCLFRGGLNYRNQWADISPYVTTSIFADGKIPSRHPKRQWMGAGIMVLNDEVGDGSLTTTRGSLLFSYTKGLSRNNSLYFSLGTGITVVNKSVNYSLLLFDEQWDGFKFNPLLYNGEEGYKESLFYFDLSVGILATYYHGKFKYTLGISMDHLNIPQASFYFEGGERIGIATVVHGGASGSITRYFGIRPEFMILSRNGATEIDYGTNVFFKMNRDLRLYFGLWNRWNRDLIEVIGFDYEGVTFLLSYDVNFVKGLRSANNFKGGAEIYITRKFGCNLRKWAKAVQCPRFGDDFYLY